MFKHYFLNYLISVIAAFSLFTTANAVCDPMPVKQCGKGCIRAIQNKITETFYSTNDNPAMQITVSFPDKERPEAFTYQTFCRGNISKELGAPEIDKNSRFQIASCTKSFTAAIVLKLIEEGKLSLKDSVNKWFFNEYPRWKDITIDQLLHHTAGIYGYDDDNFNEIITSNLAPAESWSAEKLTDIGYRGKDTGAGWNYSGTNYILLERIVEKVTGGSFKDAMVRLFDKHELLNTVYDPITNPTKVVTLAHGYEDTDRANGRDFTKISLSCEHADGGIISTSEDLAKWTRTIFSTQFLPSVMRSQDALVSMSDGLPLAQDSYQDGYGYGVRRDFFLKTLFWWHPGITYGYTSMFVYVPKTNVVITAVINRGYPDTTALCKMYYLIFEILKNLAPL